MGFTTTVNHRYGTDTRRDPVALTSFCVALSVLAACSGGVVGDDATPGSVAAVSTSPTYTPEPYPQGYGVNTTGGAGGPAVYPSTGDDLEAALCGAFDANHNCIDDAPRIIVLPAGAAFDFTAAGKDAPHPWTSWQKTVCKTKGATFYPAYCKAPQSPTQVIARACAQYQACGTATEYVDGTIPGCTIGPGCTAAQSDRCSGKSIVSLTVDAAPSYPLVIGGNKTVIGSGAGSIVRGRGFKIGTTAHRTKNVIVRNLVITDLNPNLVFGGDAINLVNVDRVWIDHNTTSNIGRQHIVTGDGQHSGADLIGATTISWNEFNGYTDFSQTCGDHHSYWNVLFDSSGDQVTMMDNWIHDFSGRAPDLDPNGGEKDLHLVNNYYQHLLGIGLEVQGANAHALVEGNYYDFQSPSYPILDAIGANPNNGASGGAIWAPQGTSTACDSLGRQCKRNLLDNTPARPIADDFHQNAAALPPFANANSVGKLVYPESPEGIPGTIPVYAGAGHMPAFDPKAVQKSDLFTVIQNGTASNQTEMYVFSGASNYQTIIPRQQYNVNLQTFPTGQTQFVIGNDTNGPHPDLYPIIQNQTWSNTTEINAFSSGSDYQSLVDHSQGVLQTLPAGAAQFMMGNYAGGAKADLFVVFPAGGSGFVEVYVLSGSSDYTQFVAGIRTPNPSFTVPGQVQFLLGKYSTGVKPDLFEIIQNGTGSGRTEVRVLSGDSGYQTFLEGIPANLQEFPAGQTQFMLGNFGNGSNSDLFAVIQNGTGSGRTEVHVLSGDSRYQTFYDHVAVNLQEFPAGQTFFLSGTY